MSENKTIMKKFFGWGKQVDGDKKVDEFIYNDDDSTVVVDGDDSDLNVDDNLGNQPENRDKQQDETEVSNLSIKRPFGNTDTPINHWGDPKEHIADIELHEDTILEKIAQEFCVNNDFLNKLGSEIANNLAEKLLNQMVEPIDAQFESIYTSRAHDFIKRMMPQIESEFKRFVTEVQHVKE